MPAPGRKRAKKKGGGWLLFWLAFFIGITVLFLVNLEKMKVSLQETRVLERLFGKDKSGTEENELELRIQSLAAAAEEETGQVPGQAGLTGSSGAEPGPTLGFPELGEGFAEAAQNNTKPANEPVQNKTVERSVYLMKVDAAGTILWTNVKRELPASDRPLYDALAVLIKGPSAPEEKQGLFSLIPKNVKIQNVLVRGNTAYISFSEDFLFNTYGVEGYAGQRRQIVLTATEFGNVRDVQILIDGRRVDYLGEGVWIGSPISRSML